MLRDWLLDVFGLFGGCGARLPPETIVFCVLVFVLRLPAVWSCALLVFVLCSIGDI